MGMQTVKHTNEYLHEPDEQAVTCEDIRICIKRMASETQDSSYFHCRRQSPRCDC